ncbi:MAG: hypothetical protein IBJ11_01805 [Phycisphaerales bacterium]|nr:hypothetical protein [Phycisphaerales bacterium]
MDLPPRDLAQQFSAALAGFAAAAQTTGHTIGISLSDARRTAERLRLDRSFAWRIGKLTSGCPAGDAARLLPGRLALSRFVNALAVAGAPEAEITDLRRAHDRLEDVVSAFAGDRPTLAALADELQNSEQPTVAESARRSAFRGNSAIWGVRAGARFTVAACAPSDDKPGRTTFAVIGGYLGLFRLRSQAGTPLIRSRLSDRGRPTPADAEWGSLETVAPDDPAGAAWIMRSLCAGELPPITTEHERDGTSVCLGAGPVGASSECDVFFGQGCRGMGPTTRVPGEPAESDFVATTLLPCERAVLDALVHRDLRWSSPRAEVHGHMGGVLGGPFLRHEALPVKPEIERFDSVAGAAPDIAADRYDRMITALSAFTRRPAEEFELWRLTLTFPPTPGAMGLVFELPS